MKQTRLRLRIPFRAPYRTSTGTLDHRDLMVVRLEDSDGTTGWGEAASLGALGPTEMLAAEEMALLDYDGRRSGRPVAEAAAPTVPVNLTLPGGPIEAVAEAARDGASSGYGCFKVKVGLGDDVERAAAVRNAIGAHGLIRLDANGAWTAAEAIEHLERMTDLGIDLVEQPCASLAELAEVRFATTVPVAADESIRTVADVLAAAELDACDLVCVKLSPAGGITAARTLIQAARDNGIEPYLSSTLDGPWGIAAGLQVAAAEGITRHCGLATLSLFDAAIATALPGPSRGLMTVPTGPGLGIEVSDAALAEVTVEI